MKLFGTQVGLGPGDDVMDGDPALIPQRGRAPQFSAHTCCAQTAGWMKMPLGTKVDIDPGHIVLDGDPATPSAKGAQQPPTFWPISTWPNGRPSQLLLSSC